MPGLTEVWQKRPKTSLANSEMLFPCADYPDLLLYLLSVLSSTFVLFNILLSYQSTNVTTGVL